MAISLGSNQLKHTMYSTPLPNTPLQPYVTTSTPKQFTSAVYSTKSPDHEVLSKNQTEVSLHNNLDPGHAIHDKDIKNLTPPRLKAPDLPSWTPLALGEKGSSPALDSETDECLTTTAPTVIKRPEESRTRFHSQEAVSNPSIAGRIPKSPSITKLPKQKATRFDGVLIIPKPKRHRPRKHSSLARRPGFVRASTAQTLTLVDALARTFDANRHPEDLSRTGSHRRGDIPPSPPADVETTPTEDEQLQSGTRLARPPLPGKRAFAQTAAAASGDASETNSEDPTSFLQDIPLPQRPFKRVKPIPYDSDAAAIDAALGTVEAPVVWNAELSLFSRYEDSAQVTNLARGVHGASSNNQMTVDKDGSVAVLPQQQGCVPPSTAAGSLQCTPTWGTASTYRTALTPYLSHGAKFRQRLEAIFGENATVRKDRAARPRPVDLDYLSPFEEADTEPSPDTSESGISVGAAPTPGEGASSIPSTHFITQSPNIPPVTVGTDGLPRNQPDKMDHSTGPTFNVDEERMNNWISALQRLAKGKIRVKDEDLEALSIALAEIESVKDSLNTKNVPMASELLKSLKQVSDLHEIPFGDRNGLRRRAENIVDTWPSMGKPRASS